MDPETRLVSMQNGEVCYATQCGLGFEFSTEEYINYCFSPCSLGSFRPQGQAAKDKVPTDVLIKRYRESEVNGLVLLHQLAQSLEFHLELKETVTSGELLQCCFKMSLVVLIRLCDCEDKDDKVRSVHIARSVHRDAHLPFSSLHIIIPRLYLRPFELGH